MITKNLTEQISDLLREQPLQDGELRRVKGMGSHYISLQPTHGDESWLFSFEINGQKIYMYYLFNAPE
jgi:hypothetical protein